MSYASSGTGSSDHLSAILFRQKTGTGVDVPYPGGAATIGDLLGSQLNASLQNLGAVLTHIKVGKLKSLATTGEANTPLDFTAFQDGEVKRWQEVISKSGIKLE